jgi:hypothetical protein
MRMIRSTRPRQLGLAATAVLLGATLAACGSDTSSTAGAASTSPSTTGMGSMAGVSAGASASAGVSASGMSGMDEPMYTGSGLSATSSGFTFVPAAGSTSALPASKAVSLSFRIEDSSGMAVTSFEVDQTKLMHFYVVRSDLFGFQHVHPTMASDGTWTASLAAMAPGTYRAYASFITKNTSGTPIALVLSKQFTVAGTATSTELPAAAPSTQVDGYTVTLSGELMAGMEHTLTATITKNGKPVTDLQPYLDTYAHLTAFHQRDMAFAHLHPQGTVNGDHGGPTLTFDAAMAAAGDYRLFLQFQTGGVLHTAALTVHVS